MALSPTLKSLIEILANGEFHSGTELASHLNISRSAICKQMKGLADLGLEIHAVSGKGYKLNSPLQLLSAQQIDNELVPETRALISSLEIHDTIDSTNHQLLTQATANNTAKVCLAEYQTSGKGRRGKQWVSPFGSNIYLSVLWHYQQGLTAINGLSLAIGIAIIKALQYFGIEDIGLKWPNDIYWQHKKLAGILIEASGEANGSCYVVVGVGLNLYLPETQGQTINQAWTDLTQINSNSTPPERNLLIAQLLNQIIPVLAHFETDTLSKYIGEWRTYDCMQGQLATLQTAQENIEGMIEGVDDKGLLLLRDTQGKLHSFASGEVSLRRT